MIDIYTNEEGNGKIMNAPTVPAGKTRKTNASSVTAPKKGSDYVVAAPSHEDPSSLSVIMSVSHSTLEY